MPRFTVDYTFQARASKTIYAESMEAARAAIEAEIYGDDFDLEADDIDDVDFRVSELHPVTRGGREMWTTYVLPSDTRGHASALVETPLFSGDSK